VPQEPMAARWERDAAAINRNSPPIFSLDFHAVLAGI
jgi:hypothetical protein